jgi:ubiquinone/menaquinone biosynthesis C-methylase UbiE
MATEMNTLWGGFTIWESTTTANVPTLVKAAGVRAGQRVLDVGTGTGVAAITAARAGAHVAAVDPTPELLAQARENAHIAQTDVDFREAGAQAMPFRDDEFDVVLSHFGHIFAPNAQQAGDEMLRVLKPGGTLAFTAWPPDDGMGAIFKSIGDKLPPPPPGTDSPQEWGNQEVVRQRLGNRVRDLVFERHEMLSPALSPRHLRLRMEEAGSGKMLVERLPPDVLAQVRAHIDENLARYFRDNIMHLPYLLVRATKA